MRYSEDDVYQITVPLVARLGGVLVQRGEYPAKGKYMLDYNPTYGGYALVYVGEDGGHEHPLGYQRRKPTAFVETVRFAIMAFIERENRANP